MHCGSDHIGRYGRFPIKGHVLPKTQAGGDADKSGGLLPYIAAFKFIKAALLLVAGSAAVGLVSPTAARQIERWLSYVSSPTTREPLQRLLARVLHHDPRTLVVVGIGAWIYAVLFLVEGVGLWKRRRWAEYLTIVATASFIPFEIYELAKELTATRVSALVLNVAILVYLIVRVWRTRRAAADTSFATRQSAGARG